jgi:hypothetical protein
MGPATTVIKSEASPVPGSGMSFRDYNYLEIGIRSAPGAPDQSVCIDTGCGMSSMDRGFFAKHFPSTATSQIPPIEIRSMGTTKTESNEYATITFYLPGHTENHKQALAEITREFHLVDNLSCNALIGNDIIEPEGITIDVKTRQAKIRSCKDLVCPLRITARGKPVDNRLVRTAQDVILIAHAKTLIPIRVKNLPPGRDFRFKVQYDNSSSYLALCGMFPEAIIDSESQFIAYYNNSDTALRLPSNTAIGHVFEWDVSEKATKENPDVINCHFAIASIIPSLAFATKVGLTALQCAQSLLPGQSFYANPDAMIPQQLSADSYSLLPTCTTSAYILLPPLEQTFDTPSKFGPEAVNINTTDDITQEQIRSLKNVIAEYPGLWEDRIGRVIEPEDDYMEIPLKEGAVIESKGRYRVSKRDEAVIDEVFDRA